MDGFVKRMKVEKSELDEKIKKLDNFLKSGPTECIDTYELKVMHEQLWAMKLYFSSLDRRLCVHGE